MTTRPETLLYEWRIVWLVPPSELPRYVREREEILPYRTKMSRRRQDKGPGVVVGYSELRPDAPSDQRQGFWRRVFCSRRMIRILGAGLFVKQSILGMCTQVRGQTVCDEAR